MKTIFHPLLVVLANLTDNVTAHQLKAMACRLQFLKAENEQLRARLPKRIVVTARERRRLIRLGKPLGAAIKDLITIVTPATFCVGSARTWPGRSQARLASADVGTLPIKLGFKLSRGKTLSGLFRI